MVQVKGLLPQRHRDVHRVFCLLTGVFSALRGLLQLDVAFRVANEDMAVGPTTGDPG